MEVTEDKVAASVLALGLLHGFVQREDVVRWADERIAATDSPPLWLIDLSLSQNRHILDVIALLKPITEGVDAMTTCRTVYALLPNLSGCTFGEASLWAKLVYRITRDCFKDDWSVELLPMADSVAETFDLVRDGYSTLNGQQATEQLVGFVAEHRAEAFVRALQPVVWSCYPAAEAEEERKRGSRSTWETFRWIWKTVWN